MTQNIFWIFELTIKEGQIDNLKKLMFEMVEATKANEQGTMAYEWTISEDNKKCHIHERYIDSEATLIHLETFLSQYAARLMETGDATNFGVYGNPSDDLKKALDGFNAKYMVPIGGFFR